MVTRLLDYYSPRTRRAVALGFAVMMSCGASVPVYAQLSRNLPRALMPAPGNAGLTMNMLSARQTGVYASTLEHPLFSSSYTGSATEILATTRYGNVSSQDLYLWMVMRDSPNQPFLSELLSKAKLPKERAELAKALKTEVDDYVFSNFVIPELLPSAPPDPIYDLKHHLYTLPVWQTVFLQKVVRPGVQITPQDRQKYLQEHTADYVEPQRLRARYIFMNSPETAVPEEQDRVEVEMDELRASILRGEITFSDAARKFSQASSASKGGEIPPFKHGELFFLFENAAAELEPGGISEIFRGPRGFYMVQLIEVLEPEEASLSNPRHARMVDEGLSRQVLKAAFDIYMRDMLLERRRIIEKPAAWDSLEDSEVVGEVCDFAITKGQVRSAFPSVEGNDLKLAFEAMATILKTMLEREAMAQEVQALGFQNDPMLERARWMAGNIIRRDAWTDQLRATLPISEQLVRNFWEKNPDLFTPLALKRVIRLTMTPSNTAPLPAQTRMEMEKVLAGASGQPVTVAVTKHVPQDEERAGLVQDSFARTEQAFEMLGNTSSEPNFYTEEYTPGSLDSLIQSEPGEVPSLGGQPAPGLDVMPAPASVTTDSLQSLVEPAETSGTAVEPEATPAAPVAAKATTGTVEEQVDTTTGSAILDLQTTGPRGGASSGPAAGGIGPVGILPDDERGAPLNPVDIQLKRPSAAPAVTPAARAVYTPAAEADVPEPVGPPIVRGSTRGALPAATPTGGQVPVGVTAPAVAPGLTLQATPNPENYLKPPATSSIPYNPEWFYARLNPTQIQQIVGQYSSSDWLLTMEDLGFVYTPDIPGAPRMLEKVPVGAFSRPVVSDQKAVSWYIEDARKVEKPPFDQVKTQAYDVYRNVQIDKATADKYNSSLKNANIQYKF